jgi:hypothetical protein
VIDWAESSLELRGEAEVEERFTLSRQFCDARDGIQPCVMPACDRSDNDLGRLLHTYVAAWEEEVYRATGLQWREYDTCQVTNWVLPKSLGEWRDRLGQREFYAASARALAFLLSEYESEGLLSADLGASRCDESKLELARQLIWDAERMLSMMGRGVLKLDRNLGRAFRANVADPAGLIASWEVLVFGAEHYGLQPFSRLPSSVALLRMTLELYVKRCFGLLYLRNRASGDPIMMSFDRVLEVLKALQVEYPDEVASEVEVDALVRINKWANITLHSGIDTFFWSVLWAGGLLTRQIVRRHPRFPTIREVGFGLRLTSRVYEEGRRRIIQHAEEISGTDVEIVAVKPCSQVG